MVSFRSILAIAPLLATALAKVAFTSVPAVAVVSQSYNISWAGGDGTSVTLTLRRGDPANLATISTIADQASGSYYIWTVPSTLQSGNDYALQITQGQSDINYSGLFTISGASSTSSSANSSASVTSAGNSTMSVTSFSPAGTGTAMSRNGTFSTATLTSSSTSRGYTFGNTGTSTGSSAGQTGTSRSTSAPSNDAPVRAGSSAALILGIVAAVMLH